MKRKLPFWKRLLFSLCGFLILLVGLIIGGELLIRFFAPQETLFPRWVYSPEYGSVWPASTTIVNMCPGEWKFIYTTNKHGFRGPAIPISNDYEKKNIVILGDSFSFGNGVNDGDQYAAVLAEQLADEYDIINISVGGWGFTQQLRAFYEFGLLYDPQLVLLQFCANDLMDNFINKVTVIRDGRFFFRNTDVKPGLVSAGLLSKCSFIQKSQLYCFIRNYIGENVIQAGRRKRGVELSRASIPPHEKFHADLLELFARDLDRRGIPLLMYAPEDGALRFPFLKNIISQLEEEGLIKYIKVEPWFENVTDYESPQGHSWGEKAHRIIGEKLSDYITENAF